MVTKTLHVTFTMMPEMYDRLEESKPDGQDMDVYIRDTLRAEIRES